MARYWSVVPTVIVGGLLAFPVNAQDTSGEALDFLFEPASEPDSAPSATPSNELMDEAPQASAPPPESSAAPEPPPQSSSGSSPDLVDTIPVGAPDQPKDTVRRSSSRLVEEIIVTAQKREENLQEVPIAIMAFSPAKLDAFGIQSAQDLERITPGLTVTNAAGFNVAYLRGVGTDAFLPGADPSVPFYVDGVALLGAQGTSDTLGRVERVEVLKGPQGTLFGRNATGGAISIVTPEPSGEFFGDLKVEFAQYNARNIQGFVNVPFGERFAASLSLFSSERDNYYINEVGPLLDSYSRGGRAKLRWDVSEDLSLTLAGSYMEGSNNAGLVFEMTRPARLVGAVLPRDPQADRRVRLDSLSGATNESTLFSLVGEWRAPWLDFKLILSDQNLEAPISGADFDKGPLPIVNIVSVKQLSKQRTAELQLLSNDDTSFSDRLQWVAGLYYLESSGGFDPIAFDVLPDFLNTLPIPAGGVLSNTLNNLLGLLNLPSLGNGVRLTTYGVLVSESLSAYAQGTWNFTETLDLTLGLRYQMEERNLLGSRTSLPQPNGNEIVLIPIVGNSIDLPQLEARQLSPRVALQWRPFDPSTQIYTSWSRAFKSPTYNTVNLLGELLGPIEPVKEEQVDSYELGVKTDLFDNSLRLNAAAFYTRQKDLLTGFVAVLSGGVVSYDNAGNAEILGAEADFLWSPMPERNPGLVITGAVSWLDTEYTSYPDGRGYDEATGLAFGPGLLPLLPARDLTGNRIVRTPEWTYTAGVNQRIEIGSGSALEFGADVYYNSGFYFLPQNSELYKRDAYHLFNARISYFYEPWNLQLTAYGQNITDTVYNEVVFVDDFGLNQVLNDPRVFGLRVNWTF